MFLRVSKQRLQNGAVLEHFQLAESVWDRQKKRSRTHILYNFGRVDDPAVVERLRKLAHNILRRCSPEEIVAEMPDWHLVDAWPYGHVFALEALWKRLGLDEVVDRSGRRRKISFAVERALFAMVANRAIAPSSKLYCWEQWLREDVRIEGTAKLELQHLYRAMDFLEANKEAIEEALYFQLGDLFHLDVDLIFYDTTSLHFEVDEEDHGVGEEDAVWGSRRAGRKKYKAPRKRGYAKNGRDDVPQIVIGLAGAPLDLPRQHRGRDDGPEGQGGLARLEAGTMRVRRRRGHGERRQPADPRPGGRQVHRVHAAQAGQ